MLTVVVGYLGTMAGLFGLAWWLEQRTRRRLVEERQRLEERTRSGLAQERRK